MSRPEFFILDGGGEPVPVDFRTWAEWFDGDVGRRVVAADELPGGVSATDWGCTMAPETGPLERKPLLDGLASCRRCRRLVLALPEPWFKAPQLAIRWNPDLLERAGIAALVGAAAVRRQGFATPPCSIHRHVAEEALD